MNDIIIWIKIGEYFIDQNNLRSVKREGKGTRITLVNGKDILVNIDYNKIKELIPS